MSNYTRMASTNKQEAAIQKIEGWLKKMNRRITGGTTVGKSPQTVILDLTYQGGEISVNSEGFGDEYPVEVYCIEINNDDYELFKKTIEDKLGKVVKS